MKTYGVILLQETYLTIQAENQEQAIMLAESGRGNLISTNDIEVTEIFEVENT